MKKFTGYINYGVLASEKRQVWTANAPHATATCSDKVEIEVPEGWDMFETNAGDIMLMAPWGWNYEPNEVLTGNEHPYFDVIDNDGNSHHIKLQYKKI